VQRWLKDNRIETLYIEPGSHLAERFCGEFSWSVPGRFTDGEAASRARKRIQKIRRKLKP
jgi:hypothetical protein